jgi:hypothetical protein
MVFFFKHKPKVYEEMKLYWENENIQLKWDTLQRDFQCCGVLNFRTGFLDWDRHQNDDRMT